MYGGTKTEMERLIKDAAKLDKSVKANDMSFGNIVKAIHAVQKNLEITGTTAKEAAETISGSAAAMQAAWSNLLTGLADPSQDFNGLLDNFISSLQTFSGNVLKLLPNIATGVQKLITGITPIIGSLVESILPTLISSAATLIQGLMVALPGLLTVIGQEIPKAIMSILDSNMGLTLPMFVGASLQMITTLANGFSDNIPILTEKVTWILTQIVQVLINNAPLLLEAGLNLVGSIAQGIVQSIPVIVSMAPQLISSWLNALVQNVGMLVSVGADIISTVGNSIITSIPSLVSVASSLLNNIVQFIKDGIPSIVTFGSDFISQTMATITEALPNLAKSASDILTSIVTYISENLPTIVSNGLEIITQIANTIGENLPALGQAAIDALTTLGSSLVENAGLLWDSVIQVVDYIGQVLSEQIPGLSTLFENLETVIAAVTAGFIAYKAAMAISAVIDALTQSTGLLSAAQAALNAVMNANPFVLIATLLASVGTALVTLYNNNEDFRKAVDEAWKKITGWISTAVGKIKGFFDGLGDKINSIKEWFKDLGDKIKEPFNNIGAFFTGVWSTITGAFSDPIGTFTSIGKNIVEGVKKGFTDAWEKAKETITGAFDGIVKGVKDFLGIKSPSKVFSDIGDNMAGGVDEGWNNSIGDTQDLITGDLDFSNSVNGYVTTFKDAASKMAHYAMLARDSIKVTFDSMANSLGTSITTINNNVSSKWNTIYSNTTSKWNSIRNTVQSVANSMNSSVSSAFSNMQSTISSRLNSIASSISNTFSNAVRAVQNAVNQMRNAMNFQWSLPYLPLPHLRVNGYFSLNPPSVPWFSVSWYRKAMNNAMILNGATIFGSMGDRLLGGGEAGQEVVSGADTLMGMIRSAVRSESNSVVGPIYINVDGAQYDDVDELANMIAEKIQGIVDRRSAAWA